MSKLISEDELAHYGIPGQKKGVRRWQYEDGRFNEEGKIRYFGTKNPRNELKNNLEKMDEFEKGQVDFQYNGIKDFIRDNIPNKKTSKKDVMQNIDDRILDAYLKDDFQEIYKLNNIKNIISQTYKEEKTFLGNMFQVFKNDASNKLGHDLSKFMFGGN